MSRYTANMPSLGVGSQVEVASARYGAKILKGASKIAGPVAVASYGYDVYEDVEKYDGKDAAKAVTVTTASTVLTIGVGFIASGVGAPIGVALIVGVLAGVGIGIVADEVKKKWIEKLIFNSN